MAQTLHTEAGALPAGTSEAPAARRAGRLTVWSLALLAGALFGTAVLLWAKHGSTVFFDTMTAGVASCL